MAMQGRRIGWREPHSASRCWAIGGMEIVEIMKQLRSTQFRRCPPRAILAAVLGFGCSDGIAQSDFHIAQIVWVVIGETAAAGADLPVRAGRHLFMAKELTEFSLRRIQIARVEALPTIVELGLGEAFCVTSLQIAAFTAAGTAVKGAPLSISVRQDHKEAMGLDRRRNNICVKGVSAGEYPIRFTSMLPAADGTARGAQVFVRIRDEEVVTGDE